MRQRFTTQKGTQLKPYLLIVGSYMTLLPLQHDCLAQTADWQRYGANIVLNDSFETETANWEIPQGMAQLSSEAHSGKNSLQFTNSDAKVYKVISQTGKAQAGESVVLSGWIKGENVRSAEADNGAALYIEAYDAAGKYVGGSHRAGLMGTFDWTYTKALYTFPENTASFVLGLYMRQGTTGKVWFDDISMRSENAQFAPVNARLLYPNYRGLVPKGSVKNWQLLVESEFPYDWEQVTGVSTITDSGGKVLQRENLALSPNSKEELTLDFAQKGALPVGEYRWNLELLTPRLKSKRSFTFPIRVVERMPDNFIDSEGFSVSEGKRFFPYGVYVNGLYAATDTDLQRISQAGFNTVLSYQTGVDEKVKSYFDRAAAHNLRVIYSIKDMYDGHLAYPLNGLSGLQHAAQETKAWRDHPALLAWYINDELGPEWAPKIRKMYDQTAALDPGHPAYQVMVKPNELGYFYDNTDAWGTDPYPISGKDMRPLRYVGNLSKATANASRGAKSVWQVLQIFDNGIYVKNEGMRPPMLEEMRNMTYQALINGSKGVLYYSYSDLYFKDYVRDPALINQEAFAKRWPDVEAMVKEIFPLTQIILQNNKVALTATSPSTVQYQAWQDKNSLHVVLANAEPKAATLPLRIPSGWKLKPQKLKGITQKLSNGTLELALAAQASGVVLLSR